MAEYGRWSEEQKTYPNVDWKKAENITAGIDVGTTSTEAVIMCDNKILCYSIVRTEMDFQNAADKALKTALKESNLKAENIRRTVCTGFGHKNVKADKYMDEIHCHAKGARYMFGSSVTTVIDMGAQTVNAIRLHKWDRDQRLYDE